LHHKEDSLNFKPAYRLLFRYICQIVSTVYRFTLRYNTFTLVAHCVLTGISVTIITLGLKLNPDRDSLVGSDKLYHRNFLEYKHDFNAEDELVVAIESDDLEKNRRFVELLGRKVEAAHPPFCDTIYRGDFQLLGENALLLLPIDTVRQLESTLASVHPFITRIANSTNLLAFFETINTFFRHGATELDGNAALFTSLISFLEEIIEIATSVAEGNLPPITPGFSSLFGPSSEGIKNLYLTLGEGRIFLMLVKPKNGTDYEQVAERIHQLINEAQRQIPGVNAELTGQPLLEIQEMSQARKDTTIASIIALIMCGALFITAYKETGRPLKVILCLVLGVVYTLAFTTVTVGSLNILTLTFLPILIGLGIDFGIHIVSRYEEELYRMRPPLQALSTTMKKTAPNIVIGAFTTSGAFLAMCLTDFSGIRQMGFICGVGIILVLITIITLLPVLLLTGRQNRLDWYQAQKFTLKKKIYGILTPNPIIVLVLAACITFAIIPVIPRVRFDYNLLNLQNPHLPSVKTEMKLIQHGSNSILFCVVIASNATDAAKFESKIKSLPPVAKIESIAGMLIDNPTPKLPSISNICAMAKTIEFRQVDPLPPPPHDITRTLWSLQGYIGSIKEYLLGQPELFKTLEALREKITVLRRTILRGDSEVISQRLHNFYRELYSELADLYQFLANQSCEPRISIDSLPPSIKSKFISRSGRILIRVYPRDNIWDRAAQHTFITALRQTLDPTNSNYPIITGVPVQLYEYSALLKHSYEKSAIYAVVTGLILAWLHFRNPKLLLLCFLPAILGFIWMLGWMGLTNQAFNLANIMTLPLMIGIGVTTGIQAVSRISEANHANLLALSTGKAIVVSNLTTVFGFGSLIIAGHQGIKSLGLIMSIGVLSSMFVALFVLPALATVLLKHLPKHKFTSTHIIRHSD